MNNKVKFFVKDENTLGYVNPVQPNMMFVLACITNLKTGQGNSPLNGPIMLPNNVRPATKQDFDTFRVSSNGYENDKDRYDFPTN